MDTWPPEPSLAMTRLGMVRRGTKCRFDASGLAWPVGKTVRKPAAVGPVAVALRTTAATPLAGTPPRPVTGNVWVPPGPTAPAPALIPSTVVAPGRLSRRRAGDSGT